QNALFQQVRNRRPGLLPAGQPFPLVVIWPAFWYDGRRIEGPAGAAGGPGLDRRRSRPARWFPARLRAGARLSPEKAGGKSAGGCAPWTPFFYGPLVGTRSFWRWVSHCSGRWAITVPMYVP